MGIHLIPHMTNLCENLRAREGCQVHISTWSFLPLFNLVEVVWAWSLQMLKKSHKLVKRGRFVPQK